MEQEEYIRELVSLARALPVEPCDNPAALQGFRELIMRDGGARFMAQVEAEITSRFDALSGLHHKYVQLLSLDPDLLTPMGDERTELAHTMAISFFLDPRRFAHAKACADRLFEKLLGDRGLPMLSPDARVRDVEAERVLPDVGRADVFLNVDAWMVLIEAKVDADEGTNQRGKYADWLRKESSRSKQHGMLIYLTPDAVADEPAETDPYPGVVYAPLSFKELFRVWLPIAAADDPPAHYLARYLKTVAIELFGSSIAARGEFSHWSPPTRNSLLDFLEEDGSAHER